MPEGEWSPETGYHQPPRPSAAKAVRRQRRAALVLLPLGVALMVAAALTRAWLPLAVGAPQVLLHGMTLYRVRPSTIRAAEQASS